MQKTDQLAAELAQNVTTLEELNTEMDVHPRRRLIPALRRQEDAVEMASERSPEGSSLALPLKTGNRRNGTSPKTIQGESGKLPIDVPRDRNGTFEPLLIGKHQRRLPGLDEKILALYAKGLTTRDIQAWKGIASLGYGRTNGRSVRGWVAATLRGYCCMSRGTNEFIQLGAGRSD